MAKLSEDLDKFEKVVRCLDERSKFEGWFGTKEYWQEWKKFYNKIILLKRE